MELGVRRNVVRDCPENSFTEGPLVLKGLAARRFVGPRADVEQVPARIVAHVERVVDVHEAEA